MPAWVSATNSACSLRARNAVSLVTAARRCQRDLRAGGDIETGRAELRRLLQQQSRGEPAVRVSSSARSTLNALAGAANAVRNQPRKDRWWEDVDPPGPQSILPPDHPNHPLNRRR
jgi:hypothetical protein